MWAAYEVRNAKVVASVFDGYEFLDYMWDSYRARKSFIGNLSTWIRGRTPFKGGSYIWTKNTNPRYQNIVEPYCGDEPKRIEVNFPSGLRGCCTEEYYGYMDNGGDNS